MLKHAILIACPVLLGLVMACDLSTETPEETVEGDEDPQDGCFLPSFAEALIDLDARIQDWGGVEPLAVDAQGDDSPELTGDDLRAVYVARDSESLYVRVDLWEPVNTNFGNGPPDEEYGRYGIVLQSTGPFSAMFIGIAFDRDRGEWSVGHNGASSDVPDGLEGPSFVAVAESVIEFGAPLALIGKSQEYTEVLGQTLTTEGRPLDQVGLTCEGGTLRIVR